MTGTKSIQPLVNLYINLTGTSPVRLIPIVESGSNRKYYLLENGAGETIVGTIGSDAKENNAFIYLSNNFSQKGLPVPKVLAESPDKLCYLQSYCGETSVFDTITQNRTTGQSSSTDINLLSNCLRLLAKIHYIGSIGLDYKKCYPAEAMDERMIQWDLNYFKYCFLKPMLDAFDEALLQDEFDLLTAELTQAATKSSTFMIRDFQSRNILLKQCNNETHPELTLIDFQGGRRGPASYDVASFLWQAKANIPSDIQRKLINDYISYALEYGADRFDENQFRAELPILVLFRVLQTLGAYGFRGLSQRKIHFIASIAPGIKNLENVFDEFNLKSKFPYLSKLINRLKVCDINQSINLITSAPATLPEKLTVTIFSFSYKKGLPFDLSGNGGGFIFDCRALHNPGRYEQYKNSTGRDRDVITFLEDDGEVYPFMTSVNSLIDAYVSRYLKRKFNSLNVAFGCTGGQHRSVYCAEALAHHLRSCFPMVRLIICHREQRIFEVYE